MSTTTMTDEDRVVVALVRHIAATGGTDLDWLDDNDRSEIAAVSGAEQVRVIVHVLDRRATKKTVARFIREHHVL